MSLALQSQLSSTTLDGKYSLLRELGRGSAGTVYEAEHLIVGKRVAIKVLHPSLDKDGAVGVHFVSEARAAARIAHANVVDIYDLGVTRDGKSYMVMELLVGETLSEIIDSRGPIAPEYACELMLQVLAGVSAAHAMGIIHRDLKPSNIIVTHPRPDRPLVKVLDFGIARGVGAIGPRDDRLFGTPMYMAPEQAMARDVDARADVYSAAAILYEMLAGRPPFSGDEATEIMAKVVVGAFRPLRDVSPFISSDLAKIVENGLARDRDQRIQSSAELALQLASFVSNGWRPSLMPHSFCSLPPIALISDGRPQDPAFGQPFMLDVGIAPKDSGFPPVELVRMDRRLGDPTMSHSLLEHPQIPRAPTTPRLQHRMQGTAQQRREPTEPALERNSPSTLIPVQRLRILPAIFAAAAGFGVGLIAALLCGAI